MTREEAKNQIEEWINLKTYKVENPSGDYIREFIIGPANIDIAQEWFDQQYRIKKFKRTATMTDRFEEREIMFDDFMVWVFITDYGKGKSVPLAEFLQSMKGGQNAYHRQPT